MSRMNLTITVLQQIAETAVKHSRLSAEQRGRVFAGFESVSRGFDADKLDITVVFECVENSNRVRPAADTRDDSGRKSSSASEHLLARFASNHRLKLANHSRIRRRTND